MNNPYNTNNPNDPYAFLASLSPGGRSPDGITQAEQQQLLGMGTLDERAALLEQQLAQAAALRQADNREHYSGAAGALSGFSNAANNVAGAYMQKQAMDQQKQLLDQKDEGRNTYASVLQRLLGGAGGAGGEGGSGGAGGGFGLFGL